MNDHLIIIIRETIGIAYQSGITLIDSKNPGERDKNYHFMKRTILSQQIKHSRCLSCLEQYLRNTSTQVSF